MTNNIINGAVLPGRRWIARFDDLKPGIAYRMLLVANVRGADGRGLQILSKKSLVWDIGGPFLKSKPFAFSIDIWWNSSWQGLKTYHFSAQQTPETRALIAANHLLLNANKLNWKKKKRIHIAVNNDKICAENVGPHHPFSAGEDPSVEKICLLEDKAGKTYDVRRKSTVMHEAGHCIASLMGGPIIGDYNGDDSSGARHRESNSKCRGDKSSAKDSHKFDSREWVGAAAMEGFAHFIAAAAQNKRSANNGVFVVSSKRYTRDSQGNTIKIPSNTAMDLNPDANGDLPQFTDKFCQPPSKYPYLGSELDWLIFLWGLWTGAPEVRFDVAEINEVWAKTKPTISLEFYSLLHTSFEAHCVPATTRKNDIISFDPASGYEKRWTCKDKPWTFNSFKVYTSTSVVDGKGRSIIVPYEKINSVASAYELWSGVYTRHNYQTQNAVIQL